MGRASRPWGAAGPGPGPGGWGAGPAEAAAAQRWEGEWEAAWEQWRRKGLPLRCALVPPPPAPTRLRPALPPLRGISGGGSAVADCRRQAGVQARHAPELGAVGEVRGAAPGHRGRLHGLW